MSEKLIIRNFGTIREAELELRKNMVLIGTQAGKSMLARLIAIFRDWQFLQREKPEMDFFEKFNLLSFFEKNTYFSYQHGRHQVMYKDGRFSSSALHRDTPDSADPNLEPEEIESLKTELVEMRSRFTSDLSDAEKKTLLAELERLLQRLRSVESKVDRAEEANSIAKSPVYFLPERVLLGSFSPMLSKLLAGSEIPPLMREFAQKFDAARRSLGAMRMNYFDVIYNFEEEVDKVYFNENHSVGLEECASDLKVAIPVQMIIAHLYTDQTYQQVWVVENLEVHLDPPMQRHMTEFLAIHGNHINSELVITTDSPYVLSSINDLLFAFQVAKNAPEKSEAVHEMIPRTQWLDPKEFNGYIVEDDGVRQILNEGTGLLNENELNRVLEHIIGERHKLINILQQKTNQM